nr:MAG TPA: hypothetical protein [Caudoviricetes sp.]
MNDFFSLSINIVYILQYLLDAYSDYPFDFPLNV